MSDTLKGPIGSARGTEIAKDCMIPPSVRIEDDVRIGTRVVFVGGDTVVGRGAVIDPAAVIDSNITIGQGALIRAGAVVLRSVPPNAIMQGNPAQVVGYRDAADIVTRADATTTDVTVFAGTKAPARLDLGVGQSSLHLMRKVVDARGSLTVGEFTDELPFRPMRYFMIFDVPTLELRGEHAHRACHQFVICVHGSCRILLDDGKRRREVTLDRPEIAIHMPPMIWGTQYRYSKDAVLLVFASLPYDSADYIRDYEEFIAEQKKMEI